jgi:hypothetical protein
VEVFGAEGMALEKVRQEAPEEPHRARCRRVALQVVTDQSVEALVSYDRMHGGEVSRQAVEKTESVHPRVDLEALHRAEALVTAHPSLDSAR